MSYKYLLFDLDGTVTDPKLGITTCVQYALKAFGIDEPDRDKLLPFIGPPLKESFEEFYGMSSEQAQAAVDKYRERFSAIGLYENTIYDGMPRLLHDLHAAGKRLAVASSKPTVFVEKILAHFEVEKYFDVVVGSELDGTRVKKEEVVAEALRQLDPDGKASKREIVMIGDRRFDVEGAKAFSLDSVGVRYGFAGANELEKAGATHIVDSVEELAELLMK